MKQIDINSTLLQRLKTDYRDAEGQVKFTNGLDYLEAMVKLFAVVNIAVVKKIDTEIYQNIFLNNFKITPSLGDFKSLATHPFTKANKNVLITKNSFYKSLYDIFSSKDLDLRLDMADDIIEGNIKEQENKKRITTLRDLFDIYVVNFRNKLKGHGASFSIQDKEQSQIILDNLDSIINAIESKLQTLLKDPQLAFFVEVNEETSEEHDTLKVFVKYGEIEYELSPLMIYLECNKFSCKDNHKVKLFFYNDGKASKSYYIDYSYNHYYYFSSNNQVDSTLNEIITYQKELNAHNTSDNLRQSNLLSVFVGREKELKDSKEYILANIASNTPSAMTIKGKPGIGKSAFISKLQVELKEKSEMLQSYIFYVRKSEMSDDENKYFYNKFVSYLDSIKISIPKVDNDDQLTPKERMEHVFETLNVMLKLPLLLVIDGLDEFANPVSFLQNFPMQNIPNKLHLVFSTRGYPNILEELQTKLFNSDFNLLNKDEYLSESISITLGKLSAYEVETLVEEVLTKDVQRGTQIYETIQGEIYEKSEGLPLYINYISNKLIEFDLESSNIANDILSYAKELPQGLDDFYFQSFNKLKTISSEILYTLYFAHKHIGFDSFYHLITGLNGFIDKKEFQNCYFNEIEIFLAQDIENKYGFYHLSVKEAIKSYFMQEGNLKAIVEIDYDTFSNSVTIAPYQEAQYKKTFDTYCYLKKESDLFEVLEKIYTYLSDKQNEEKLLELHKDNYLTYFYKYIHFKNYHEIMSFEDMFRKNYTKFENVTLSDDITKLIEKFFIAYESSLKQDISEIKYAHEFALLTHDYNRVLSYAKDYEDAFFTQLIDIVRNIDKLKNQKFFKELKPIWSKMYSDEFKSILLYNKKLWSLPEYMIEIVDSFELNSNKSSALVFIVKKIEDPKLLEKVLMIVDTFEYDLLKSAVLESILEKTDDPKVLKIALNTTSTIEDDKYKLFLLSLIVEKSVDEKVLEKALEFDELTDDALESIADKIVDTGKAFEIAKSIKNDLGKSSILTSIVKKTDDPKQLEKALDTVYTLEYDNFKSNILIHIMEKTKDQKVVEKALEVASKINYELLFPESEALVSIVNNTENPKLLKKALEIANTFEFERSGALVYIVRKTEDPKLLEKALDIANTFEYDGDRSEALESIVEKTEDPKLLELVLKVVSTIVDGSDKYNVLSSIVKKTEDTKVLQISLKVASEIEDEWYKSILVALIGIKMDDQMLIGKALDIAEAIAYDRDKSSALANIGSIINESKILKKALEVALTITDNRDKSEVLAIIGSEMKDPKILEKALEIAEAIADEKDKSFAFTFIGSIINDEKVLKKSLEFVFTIKEDNDRAEALEFIESKMDYEKMLENALEIADTSKFDLDKFKVLKFILKKTEDTGDTNVLEKVLKITDTFEDDKARFSVLEFILDTTKDIKVLEKALDITDRFKNETNKSDLLDAIIAKTEDPKLLDSALEIVNSIKYHKEFRLKHIIKKSEDPKLLEKALKIVSSFKYDHQKADLLDAIIAKTENLKLLEKALELIDIFDDDRYMQKILQSIVTKTDNPYVLKKALVILDTLKVVRSSELLRTIVKKTDDTKLLEKSLEIADTCEEADVMALIGSKMDDQEILVKALKIVSRLDYNKKKYYVLEAIIKKTADQKMLEKVLKVISTLDVDSTKLYILRSLVNKADDTKLLEKSLEIADTCKDDAFKSEVLAIIGSKINDPKVLEKALETASILEKISDKFPELEFIIEKIEDPKLLEKALEILVTMEISYLHKYTIFVLIVIISVKMDNHKVLEKALDFISRSRFYDAIALTDSKTDDRTVLEKVLKIVDAMGTDSINKLKILLSIIKKSEDLKILEKVLKIVSSFESDYLKSDLLDAIIAKTEDPKLLDSALELTDIFDDDRYTSQILQSIVAKTDNQYVLKKALVIADILKDNLYKAEVLTFIGSKMNDQKMLEKAFESVNIIEFNSYNLDKLLSIIEKIENQDVLEKTLDIAESFEDYMLREKTLSYIKKKNNALSYLNNYLYKFNTVSNFYLHNSINYVALYNEDAIFRYYGVLEDEDTQNNDLISIIKELHDIKSKRDIAEESEDEDMYEKLSEEAESIKIKILEDESMLNDMLQRYDLKKLAFKKRDILETV